MSTYHLSHMQSGCHTVCMPKGTAHTVQAASEIALSLGMQRAARLPGLFLNVQCMQVHGKWFEWCRPCC